MEGDSMLDVIQDFFRNFAAEHPAWNFVFFFDERQWGKVVSGLWMTIKLSVVCVVFSVIIGIAGPSVAAADRGT